MEKALVKECNLTDVSDKIETLRAKLTYLYDATSTQVHNEVLKFSYHLELKYADAKECMLFLLIIGGTLPSSTKLYDFEGRDSVQRFIDQLYLSHVNLGVA